MTVGNINISPMPSAKKRSASKKKKSSKLTKHQKVVNQKRAKRAGMTIAQCIAFSIRSTGKKDGLLFRQIRACLKRSGVDMSNFIIKNVLNKMVKWGVVKRTSKTRYILTGKRCPSHLNNKQVNNKRRIPKKQRIADRKFKNTMRKAAKKMARGGRTFEQCVHAALGKRKNRTLNEIHAMLNKQAGMKTSKFVLKHVMDRLRAKKVVKIYQFRYKNTGNKFPAKKRRSNKSKK